MKKILLLTALLCSNLFAQFTYIDSTFAGSHSNTLFIGNSLTIDTTHLINHALFKPVKAHFTIPNVDTSQSNPNKLVDNQPSTVIVFKGVNSYFIIDLIDTISIERFELLTLGNNWRFGGRAYELYAGLDSTNMNLISQKTISDSCAIQDTFPSVDTRYLKYVVTEIDSRYSAVFSEFRLIGDYYDDKADFISKSIYSGSQNIFSSISVEGANVSGANLKLRFRAGDHVNINSTWTDWTEYQEIPAALSSISNKTFFQYHLKILKKGTTIPMINKVKINYSEFPIQRFRLFTSPDLVYDHWLSKMAIDKDDNIWFISRRDPSNAVYKISNNRTINTFAIGGGKNDLVSVNSKMYLLYSDYNHNILRVTTDSIWHNVETPGNVLYYASKLFADRSGNLWIIGNGAVKYDGNNWTIYRTNTCDIPSNYTTAIAQDSDGNIWIGTSDKGLAQLNSSGNWILYNVLNGGSPYDAVSKIDVFDNGNILVKFEVSSYSEQSYLFNRTQWTLFFHDSKNYVIERNNVWYSDNGLRRISGNDTLHFTASNSFISSPFYYHIDSRNNLWFLDGDYNHPFIYQVFTQNVLLNQKEEKNILPAKICLEQNYPNPFNPATTISYSLPASGHASIKVYDILGKEITTLVNDYKTPGNYKVNFNKGSLASGVYFYRLIFNGNVSTKKMLILK